MRPYYKDRNFSLLLGSGRYLIGLCTQVLIWNILAEVVTTSPFPLSPSDGELAPPHPCWFQRGPDSTGHGWTWGFRSLRPLKRVLGRKQCVCIHWNKHIIFSLTCTRLTSCQGGPYEVVPVDTLRVSLI